MKWLVGHSVYSEKLRTMQLDTTKVCADWQEAADALVRLVAPERRGSVRGAMVESLPFQVTFGNSDTYFVESAN